MHDWQSLQRWLLLNMEPDLAALSEVLKRVRTALPEAELTLLTASPIPSLNGITAVSFASWGIAESPTSSEVATQGKALIQAMQQRAFEAAIIFTPPERSPHTLAYLCYLAGIPLRVGQSQEFGGGVLSTWVRPPIDPVPLSEYYLHLLSAVDVFATAHPG